MKCKICPNDIHPVRLEILPNTKTCSADCASELQKHHKRKSAKAQWKRKQEVKAKKAAAQKETA